ncbi:MAG: hypothetical protein ACM3PY_05530 [Omnitrophica WOR_2 bacterium]
MNHQLFEKWLFSEEPLLPEQDQALREHMQACQSCRTLEKSWNEVAGLFKSTISIAPAPGFGTRWQARLAEERRKRQQRQVWTVLALTCGSATILFWVLFYQLFSLLRTPDELLYLVVYRLSAIFIYAETTEDILRSFLAPFISAIPLPAWIGLIGLISLLSVLWFVAFQQLTSTRRIRL